MSASTKDSSQDNAHRLLWAGFMAILAAGVGFSVRGGILGQWAEQYGFTMTELGNITGGGLFGFGVIILISSFLADAIGYGRLMWIAFITHFVSAVLTLGAGWAFEVGGKDSAYWCLYVGMFLFAVGNGVCEAVVNPLVASLFPKDKTHYLNILHAGWPGGLIIGGLLSYFMAGNTAMGIKPFAWQIQMSCFLVPVVLYGAMIFGQRFPKSEATEAGVSYGKMFSYLFHPLMITLLVIHAMVGYVELGTDSWISKITGAIMNSAQYGLLLFVYTSGLMFALRFFAGPIVEKTSPIGLLVASALLGFTGLQLLSVSESIVMCVIAATVYAFGKTFLWPTMLAVVSERFPQGGAITIGAMGGIGMLSAGLLGGPGIGFKQDMYASNQLKSADAPLYEKYKAEKENHFLWFSTYGLDGAKVGVLEDGGKELARDVELYAKQGKKDDKQAKMQSWWNSVKETAETDKPKVQEAGLYGGRMALRLTSFVPATMAVLYFLLFGFFAMSGGYKQIHIGDEPKAS